METAKQQRKTAPFIPTLINLLDLIATLEIERPILLGYSMGAYISAIAASRLANTESLILLDGAGLADESTRQLVLPSLERLKKKPIRIRTNISRKQKKAVYSSEY